MGTQESPLRQASLVIGSHAPPCPTCAVQTPAVQNDPDAHAAPPEVQLSPICSWWKHIPQELPLPVQLLVSEHSSESVQAPPSATLPSNVSRHPGGAPLSAPSPHPIPSNAARHAPAFSGW